MKNRKFIAEVRKACGKENVFTDELRCCARGVDAGFYRLIPEAVVCPGDEAAVSSVLRSAYANGVPLTFRAAGTSLSGQGVSDSVLVVAGKKWERYELGEDAGTITLEPGIVGERVNRILAPFGRKFGPDPASIKSAMVGGIVANNSSGMSCGVWANSDKLLVSARLVFSDGTVLDTGDEASRESFRKTHPHVLEAIGKLRDDVIADKALTERIRRKYSIKNVTGLNILPLVSYSDPFDIIAHSIVGSEGTLAFISSVTMRTLPVPRFKADAMIYFNSITEAASAVVAMKGCSVTAAEMLDRRSLVSVGDNTGDTAVLTQVTASSESELESKIEAVKEALKGFDTVTGVEFTTDPARSAAYWAIRSAIFPTVGAMRELGTTCLIEDVAFPLDRLPEATADLSAILDKYCYTDSCIYGHALDGNFHFIINQSFGSEKEIRRYESLIKEVSEMVVGKYDGSLKAEHGTGRNVAPFVEYEWGSEAYQVMKRLKAIFDPKGILNPGVIFNDDPDCFISNIKSLPLLSPGDGASEEMKAAFGRINRCIECGFCEVNCVSCGFTLSSRNRVAVNREFERLRLDGSDEALKKLARMKAQYKYPGEQTCAGDGLCSTSCPMGINVADLTHEVRRQTVSGASRCLWTWSAGHFAVTKDAVRGVLALAQAGRSVLGDKVMGAVCRGLHDAVGLPLWTPAFPRGYRCAGAGGGAAESVGAAAPGVGAAAAGVGVAASGVSAGAGVGAAAAGATFGVGVDSASAAATSGVATAETGDPVTAANSGAENTEPLAAERPKVVYFPSCFNQMMGAPKGFRPLVEETLELLEKAGYDVVYPEGKEELCCGTIWESKGMPDIAEKKVRELETALLKASCGGKYPILCDQSPCLHRMRKCIESLKLYEPAEFVWTFLKDRLTFVKDDVPVALHLTCSSRLMGVDKILVDLASLCSTNVLVPDGVGCCGFAGDKGMQHPELNAWALRKLRSQIEDAGIRTGYSNSRTCEIGLQTNSGIPYVSIVYLVNSHTV